MTETAIRNKKRSNSHMIHTYNTLDTLTGIYPPVKGEARGLRKVRLGGVYEFKKAVPAKRYLKFP